MDIVVWLRSLGLGKYEAAFRENSITEKVLPRLTAEDLKELGVSTVGDRRVLLDAIADLRTGSGEGPCRANAEEPDRRLRPIHDLGNRGAVKSLGGDDLFGRFQNPLNRLLTARLMGRPHPLNFVQSVRHYSMLRSRL